MVIVEQREQMRQLAWPLLVWGAVSPRLRLAETTMCMVHPCPRMLHLGSSAYDEMGQRDVYFCVTGMY